MRFTQSVLLVNLCSIKVVKMHLCVCKGENLAFWEAAEELTYGTASSMSTKAETIFK